MHVRYPRTARMSAVMERRGTWEAGRRLDAYEHPAVRAALRGAQERDRREAGERRETEEEARAGAAQRVGAVRGEGDGVGEQQRRGGRGEELHAAAEAHGEAGGGARRLEHGAGDEAPPPLLRILQGMQVCMSAGHVATGVMSAGHWVK